MVSYEDKLRQFAVQLFKIDAVKFGCFKTKMGLKTPVYCDLRVLVSFPDVMDSLTDLLVEQTKKMSCFDLICGVPYTALPIAMIVSMKMRKAMVMRRKEAKDYGTRKLIEGTFKPGYTCLIVEDVVTSGMSIMETVGDLTDVGIKSTDVIVLLDREQGGKNILKQHGIKMHSLLTLTQLMEFLEQEKCVGNSIVQEVKDYLKETQVDPKIIKLGTNKNRLQMSYGDRKKHTKNPIAAELLEIIETKKTNLCLAADLTSATDLLNLAEQVGPHICLFKTHIDIVEDFHENFLKCLQEIAKTHNFLLFEDRKFSDIGKMVELQFTKGIHRISSWANIVTCHSLMGRGALEAIKNVEETEKPGIFLLAETSAAGSLITDAYVEGTMKMATEYSELVIGVVCQTPLFLDKPGFLQLTPGVQLTCEKDDLGQTYNTPQDIMENGADIAVVGRGITLAPNTREAAKNYQEILWDAYLKRISS